MGSTVMTTSDSDPGKVDRREADHAALARRDAILEAVGFAAERFLRSASWEDSIQEVLERLGQATGVSRTYLFENRTASDCRLLMDEVHEWVAPGATSTLAEDWNHDLPYLPGWKHYVDTLGAGEAMSFGVSTATGMDLSDLHDEGILSTAFVPIFTTEEEWWGYLGFDDCEIEREWSKAELDALKVASSMLGAAIGRERADVARVDIEARYRALVEQIPAVTYIEEVTDPEDFPYPTAFISPQVREVLGYTPEELVADPRIWDVMIHPDDKELQRGADVGASRDGHRYEAEYRVIAKDGSVVWLHDEAIMLGTSPPGKQVWHGVLYDITALREALLREQDAAARLRALDEMKDTFLNAVSHDLRTPVSAILGLSLTLARDEGGLIEAEKKEFAERIAGNARKLQRLVNDLLDLDRLTRGVIELDRRRTSLERLVVRVLEESDVSSTHPVSLDARPTVLEIDAAKVERIVENLLVNAARHTPPGTSIHVAVRPQDGGALIVVEDEGPGVPEDLREAIFEPFRQVTSGPSPGVGIGLSLVARFAELHGGRAWVEEREGGGASFKVLLLGPV